MSLFEVILQWDYLALSSVYCYQLIFRNYRLYFGLRMKGEGIFADQIAQMFSVACRRVGLSEKGPKLLTDSFRVPVDLSPQLSFGWGERYRWLAIHVPTHSVHWCEVRLPQVVGPSLGMF